MSARPAPPTRSSDGPLPVGCAASIPVLGEDLLAEEQAFRADAHAVTIASPARTLLSLAEAMPEDAPPEPSADVVSRYFEADAQGDVDALLALFDADAVVIDERQAWRGKAEIRDWRLGPAAKYEYTTTITKIDRVEDDHYRASGRIDGNFPGATASLKWDFFLAEGLISRLEIAP